MKDIFGPALGRLLQDAAGVTAIEYALLGSLIAAVIAGAVSALGTAVDGLWTLVSNAVASL